MKNVQAFYEAVVKDAALREKVAALGKLEQQQQEELLEALVKIAKEAGFDVTVEELKAWHPANKELSDEELGNVSGGFLGEFLGESDLLPIDPTGKQQGYRGPSRFPEISF